MDIRTILLPVDFSTCSMLVAAQAGAFASRLGARVVVLNVAELPPGVAATVHVNHDGKDTEVGAYLLDDTLERLAPFADAVRSAGAEAATASRIGPVAPTVVAAAEELGADLIIMGTHGRTGLARMVLGSVAEGVSRAARVPVMLLRRETRPECASASCDWCPHDGRSQAVMATADAEGAG